MFSSCGTNGIPSLSRFDTLWNTDEPANVGITAAELVTNMNRNIKQLKSNPIVE